MSGNKDITITDPTVNLQIGKIQQLGNDLISDRSLQYFYKLSCVEIDGVQRYVHQIHSTADPNCEIICWNMHS